MWRYQTPTELPHVWFSLRQFHRSNTTVLNAYRMYLTTGLQHCFFQAFNSTLKGIVKLNYKTEIEIATEIGERIKSWTKMTYNKVYWCCFILFKSGRGSSAGWPGLPPKEGLDRQRDRARLLLVVLLVEVMAGRPRAPRTPRHIVVALPRPRENNSPGLSVSTIQPCSEISLKRNDQANRKMWKGKCRWLNIVLRIWVLN